MEIESMIRDVKDVIEVLKGIQGMPQIVVWWHFVSCFAVEGEKWPLKFKSIKDQLKEQLEHKEMAPSIILVPDQATVIDGWTKLGDIGKLWSTLLTSNGWAVSLAEESIKMLYVF